VRLLFTFVGGRGHFEPLAAIARVARDAGCEVAFGCPPGQTGMVEGAGFRALPIGEDAGRPPRRLPLQPIDRAREERDLRERFVRGAGGYRAPRVAALLEEWRPDALVCDETDFGAGVAAERRGLPFASVLVTASGSFVRPDVVGPALDALRAEHGLPSDPDLASPGCHLVLCPFPPSLRDPAFPLPATARCYRLPLAGASGPKPEWADVRPGASAVYVTLGTVFNLESGDLLARAVAALRELPVNLLVTVGSDLDPAELGAQPAQVRVERYVPQAEVLPWCDAVVSHAGSGGVLGALSHGLPSVLIPLGADQPWNADRCAALGVARVLDALAIDAAELRDALTSVLEQPGYRRRAERIAAEIAALPDVSETVRWLEDLGAAAE